MNRAILPLNYAQIQMRPQNFSFAVAIYLSDRSIYICYISLTTLSGSGTASEQKLGYHIGRHFLLQ